ncbi:hypothetical protein [Nostoc spongiaeforme]|uniref:hypothetical protein n=1 Tax=Nostoc spongiaeforme TaxID=502487 RepID=UPI0016895788|nr:hypothetical protein [Nostoc spongiaeforme]
MSDMVFEHIHLIGKRDRPYTTEVFSSRKLFPSPPGLDKVAWQFRRSHTLYKCFYLLIVTIFLTNVQINSEC